MDDDLGLPGPADKDVQDLANDLILAQGEGNDDRGRAVFLIGAGCSKSAGIPSAPEAARHCAVKLASRYSKETFKSNDADLALQWLIDEKQLELRPDQKPDSENHWENLYHYFFEHHYKSPNQQRDIINELVKMGNDQLNWAHACIGELVHRRFVHTVLTTNFDQLVLQAIVRTGEWPVISDGQASVNRIIGNPKRPQVVHLHGSLHTYNLLNSARAVASTRDDKGTASMIDSLLLQSDVLVVVGYRGGEDGIMQLLKEAANRMQQLVIYWVSYEGGAERLSDNAQQLLRGENKFLIRGGDADKFFGDLMAELGLGQPQWVRDPISALENQSKKLVTPIGQDLEVVEALVGAYKERVEFSGRPEHRWPKENEAKILAAELNAMGQFASARTELEKFDFSSDPVAKRLHAISGHSIFDRNPDENRDLLENVIREFSELVEMTDGPERLANVMSLLSALFDLSEQQESDSERDKEALKRIMAAVERWQAVYTKDADLLAWSRLSVLSARAKQTLAERANEDVALLQGCLEDFTAALDGLVRSQASDANGRVRSQASDAEVVDAKAGLAGVLQILGEKEESRDKLEDAVTLFREVVEQSRTKTGQEEDAGPYFNLSGALLALAKMPPMENLVQLGREIVAALNIAQAIYIQKEDSHQIESVRKRLDALGTLLATKNIHSLAASDEGR
jgi:hypothetical protein